ncbi:MAG: type II secretion system F family protein [Actinomycetota bacterium]
MLATAAVLAATSMFVWPSRNAVLGVMIVAGLLVHPIVAAGLVGSVAVVVQLRRLERMRRDASETEDVSVLALEMIALGVTAGLPFRNAADLTAKELEGGIGDDINQGLRSVSAGRQPTLRTDGLRVAFSLAASAESSGMPLASSLVAAASDRRRESAAAAKERLARLPVKMLFPLAFLILPGFVLLAVVPPLVSGLSRLGI